MRLRLVKNRIGSDGDSLRKPQRSNRAPTAKSERLILSACMKLFQCLFTT